MIWRSSNVGCGVVGKIHSQCGVCRIGSDMLLNRVLPPLTAIIAKIWSQQLVRFDPEAKVPLRVQNVLPVLAISLQGDLISDPNRQGQHFWVVIVPVRGVLFRVENRRRKNRSRKASPTIKSR